MIYFTHEKDTESQTQSLINSHRLKTHICESVTCAMGGN